jgi:hypothetical protein
VSFPQAAGCYGKTLRFHSIKHHLKPTWITVWLPEDRSYQKNPPLTSPTTANLNLFKLSATLFVISGRIDMISNKVNSAASAGTSRKLLQGS